MLFNSLQFALFMIIVFILYWMLPHKYRWMLLLISSYYFYMSWNPIYILLLFTTTLITYLCGLVMEKAVTQKAKKVILSVTLLFCMGTLFFFKYFSSFFKGLCDVLSLFSLRVYPIALNILLPVGISFYTFQTLSYVIDIYRGNIKAEHHFGMFAAFVSFFPQLVAGPIERASNLLPQIREKKNFDYNSAVYGLKLMLWGYFKKVIIADTLAQYVDAAYKDLSAYRGFGLVIAVFFFTIQIYCDFSGYSDIAIGTARLLGVYLMTNFKSPYYSASIKEFWRRWHISLSTWFRDYLYIPLGGGHKSKGRNCLNVLITFLASGIWHGANLTFFVWGGIHGVAQIVEKICSGWCDRIRESRVGRALLIIIVFIFCSFAWIFFRAQTILDALYVLGNMWAGISDPFSYLRQGFAVYAINVPRLLYLLACIGVLMLFDFLSVQFDVIDRIKEMNVVARWTIYIILALWIIFFSEKGVAAEFIYFQF